MSSIRTFVGAALPLAIITLVPSVAAAITLPDRTCNSSPCLQITNNPVNQASMAIYAVGAIALRADGSSVGVIGETMSGTGVDGDSTSGIGVHGSSASNAGIVGASSSNNGVRGTTGSTTNAAVAALAPSSDGLAFYGTGGIIISGSVAKKAGGGPWVANSDARIKKEVRDLEWGLDELRRVRAVTYKYTASAAARTTAVSTSV